MEYLLYHDGTRTYRILDGHLTIYPKLRLQEMAFPPLFGTTLLGAPLFRPNVSTEIYKQLDLPAEPYRADVYFQPGEVVPPTYIPCYVLAATTNGMPVIKALYAISPTQPLQTIEMSYGRSWPGMSQLASRVTVKFLVSDCLVSVADARRKPLIAWVSDQEFRTLAVAARRSLRCVDVENLLKSRPEGMQLTIEDGWLHGRPSDPVAAKEPNSRPRSKNGTQTSGLSPHSSWEHSHP